MVLILSVFNEGRVEALGFGVLAGSVAPASACLARLDGEAPGADVVLVTAATATERVRRA